MASDLVTLSWCLGEIRQALSQSEKLLEKQLQSDAGDLAGLRAARAALHQAHGALQVVDIEGVSLLTQESEALLDAVERGETTFGVDVVSKLGQAYQALVEYLEDLLQGLPVQPLHLFPYYKALLEARRAERVHPADLFFPDLSIPPAAVAAPTHRADTAALAGARGAFERGLLQSIREPSSNAGSRLMHGAVRAVRESTHGAANRAFWWVTEAYFDALERGLLPLDVGAKRLLARFNLQLRKTLEERAPVSERLLKDMLFSLATVKPGDPAIDAVRQAYRLDGAIPDDFERPRFGRVDAKAMRAAREALAKARMAFDKVTRGSAADISAFAQGVDGFRDAIEQLPTKGLQSIGRVLGEVRRTLNADSAYLPEAVALELATTILFAEQALDQGARPDVEHDHHGEEMAARLSSALAGRAQDPDPPDWLRALSQAAQERLTMSTFISEALSSLRQVEKVLDGYFRDTTQASNLPECVRAMHQVAGALRLLGHDAAARGAELVGAQVTAFADATPDGQVERFEKVAASVGALGFFVEGLQHPERAGAAYELDEQAGEFRVRLGVGAVEPEQPAIDAEAPAAQPASALSLVDVPSADAMAPLVEASSAAPALSLVAQPPPDQASAEAALAALAAQIVPLHQAWSQDPQTAPQLLDTLQRMRDASALVDDAGRKAACAQALSQLQAPVPDPAALRAALVAAGVPLPALAQPAPVLPADELAIDSELLEIFLAEADEVLQAIDEHVRLSADSPRDQAHLTTMRRGFHTLKGSSRMVGLNDFGEAGWAMEQVLNLWLAEERPGDPDLYSLIGFAHHEMIGWVGGLRAGALRVDPRPIVEAAKALRDGAPLPVLGAAAGADEPMPDEAIEVPAPTETLAAEPQAIETLAIEDFEAIESDRDAPGLALSDDQVLAGPLDEDHLAVQGAAEEPSALGTDWVDSVTEDTAEPAQALSVAGTDEDSAILLDEVPTVERRAPDPAPDVVRIGERTISRPLYLIFLSEADELIQTLSADTAQWRQDPARHASEAAARAVHSLAGSAAVVQLDGVHALAETLERVYSAQRGAVTQPSENDFAVIAHAVDRIHAMLHQFAAGAWPAEEPAVLASLQDLMARWAPMMQIGDISEMPSLLSDEAGLADAASDAFAPTLPALDLAGAEGPAAELEEPVEPAQALLPESPAPIIATEPAAHSVDQPAPQTESPEALAEMFAPAPAQEGVAAALAEAPVDELDPELLAIFIEEADDDLPRIGENLRAWAASPGDGRLPQTLMRLLHTVKGSARMAGAMRLGQKLHDTETRVEDLAALPATPAQLIEELIAEVDQAVAMFEAIKHPVAPAPAAPVVQATPAVAEPAATMPPELPVIEITAPSPAMLVEGTSHRAPDPVAGETSATETPVPATPAAEPALLRPAEPAPAKPADTPVPANHPLVRVRADLLDKLVNEAGEVSIARSRLDNELTTLRQSLADLTENVARLRSQLREIEIQADTQIQARIAQQKEHERSFDPLEFDRYTRFQELTRMMAESVNDVATVQGNSMRSLDEASQDLHRQGQVLRDLQQNLMRVRMVQFGSISDRLYRVVRQSAKETDKRVHLDLRGATVEVDRGVLERMAGPIEHLLRNAVAHGIEAASTRHAHGKSETGEIQVEVRQEGREIVLSFADDGSGLDLERIRQRAVAQGLINADSRPSDRELADLIFVPGFSTAASVTELSGRGVGMDVVRSEVASLGGRIETETQPGHGTRFTVHLPLTLAVSQVVLVAAGRSRFAVPSSSVEQVLQLKPQALAEAYADRSIEWQGQNVPLFFLGSLVESPDVTPLAQHHSPVVIIRSGHQRIALHADEITRNQEVVVKNVGPQVARVRGVTGATVLGNGEIVLIVNPVALAQAAAGEVFDRAVPAPTITAVLPDALPPVVMVVDDSLTVRKVTQRLLTREGYQVLLAKDGVDALRQLQDVVPDAMLLDIEMPRMDGFDLTRNLRADERFANMPIIMITSRTADKHRNHAMALGVNVYLGKPYSEDELLAHLAHFTESRHRMAATLGA